MINVIYEDSHIIAVEKQPKIPSQSDSTGDKDMYSLVKEYVCQKYSVQNPYLGLVHRLDRPVGGIMLFAKTQYSNTNLSEQMRNKSIKKQYIAVVCGISATKSCTLHDYLKKNGKLNISKVVPENTRGAKEALLDYDVINTKDNLSLLRINLHTGRHHQIRAQLANAGIPVWGDTKYNIEFQNPNIWTQIALWSESVDFIHPKTKKIIKLKSEPIGIYPFTEFGY